MHVETRYEVGVWKFNHDHVKAAEDSAVCTNSNIQQMDARQ